MRPDLPYKRLPGRSQQYFGVVWLLDLLLFLGQNSSVERMRLYDGGDHLLLVRQKFFTERVHRFYLSDIQAITVDEDGRWHLATFLLIATMVSIVALLLSPQGVPAGVDVALWGLLGAGAVLLALHLMRGPTCVTQVHTAVARVRLLNLERWRVALQLARALSPRIAAAQPAPEGSGEVSAAEMLGAPLVTGQQSEPPMLARRTESLKPGEPRETMIFSSLLIACALSAIFDIFFYNTLKNIGDCFLYTLVLVVGAVGYGRIRKTQLPGSLKAVHVLGLTSIIVLYYISQLAMTGRVMFSFALEEAANPQELAQPIVRVISIVSATLHLLLAGWGFWGVWRYWNVYRPLNG